MVEPQIEIDEDNYVNYQIETPRGLIEEETYNQAFFSEETGYQKYQIATIRLLAVNETYTMDCHTVTRLD